tara:strand:+ start:938 stop:1465 length:528 start_codon:yes stop_codon:yes gene_type:complete
MSIVNNIKMNKQKLREFKMCMKCNKELKWDKFRERKDAGWKDINKKLRYSYCKKCEANVASVKYRKNPIPQLFYNIKKRAAKSKVPFNLTVNDLKNLLKKSGNICPILGVKMEINELHSNNKEYSPSFDRIYPKKGYTKGNMIVISDKANRIKTDATVDEIRKVADFYENILKNR